MILLLLDLSQKRSPSLNISDPTKKKNAYLNLVHIVSPLVPRLSSALLPPIPAHIVKNAFTS
jgi:hypothetical protein